MVLLTGRERRLLGEHHVQYWRPPDGVSSGYTARGRYPGPPDSETREVMIWKLGRDHSDRAELLFRSLADPRADEIYLVEEDKLLMDVLAAIQPPLGYSYMTLRRDTFKPMAERLGSRQLELEELRIPLRKLQLFMCCLGVFDHITWFSDQPVISEGVTYAMFQEIYSNEVSRLTKANPRTSQANRSV